MAPALVEQMIPIVALVVTFAFPVALVFTFKWFRLKERELAIDAELRKTAGVALEQRVQRLESIILALDADLRTKIGAPEHAHLMEAPPLPVAAAAGPDVLPIKAR